MKKIPFLYKMMRGAIGKRFVVKHYKGGKVVVTRFPDMSGIVPTEKQKVRRDLFREAVVWAKWVIADENRKRAFRNTLPRKKRRKVYQAALQLYMQMKGSKLWLRKVLESMEKEWARNCVDIRKQLAVQAVVEQGMCEEMVRVVCVIGNKQLAAEAVASMKRVEVKRDILMEKSKIYVIGRHATQWQSATSALYVGGGILEAYVP